MAEGQAESKEAGRQLAWRLRGSPGTRVTLRSWIPGIA